VLHSPFCCQICQNHSQCHCRPPLQIPGSPHCSGGKSECHAGDQKYGGRARSWQQ